MAKVHIPVEIFCSYTHEDEAWLRKLETHLSLLKQQSLVSLWYNRLIAPGTDWAKTINTHLETASVILLLVSADFFTSDYCYGIEMQRALEREAAGEAQVIPILVRPVDWKDAPFEHLQVLPTDAKPLTSWQDQDAALADVAAGIRRVIVEELPQLSVNSLGRAAPTIWDVPYPRNPFFVGRDDELLQLHQHLQEGQAMALSQPQAISGLGGIGKTQLALEYAYRYRSDYQVVLWARAESTEALVSSYVAIASLLRLPEHDAQGQDNTVQAVKVWLQTHRGWLLVLDNADELLVLPNFLPSTLGGHLLLTTRAQAVGRLAHRLEVETLLPEQGALLLLRRAGLIEPFAVLSQVSAQQQALAMQLTQELGGLPLALDQAGAYLEETRTDLTGYWQIYQRHRTELLQRRGGLVVDYPASVATTWSLSFQQLQAKHPAAAELLYLCAFLSPDAIPEELFEQGAACLGPILAPVTTDALLLDQAIEALLAYSLVRRDPKGKTLSIHRLVQAVLRDALEKTQQRMWMERAIYMVNVTFPYTYCAGSRIREQCERLLPQALATTQGTEQYQMINEEAGRLLYKTAFYLYDRARYGEAKLLFQQALYVQEQCLGSEHLQVAATLNCLADLYHAQGKYVEAKPLYQRAQLIGERCTMGPELSVALNGLAMICCEQDNFVEAEPLFQRAIRIGEQRLGSEHPYVANTLHNLGDLYLQQGKYAEAEALLLRAVQIYGLEHFEVVYPLTGLAEVSHKQGRLAEAEQGYQRAIHIGELLLGSEHAYLMWPLRGLADLCRKQEKYGEAETLYQRSFHIGERVLGLEHPYLADSYNGLANLYHEQGKYVEAEQLFWRALRIREQTFGSQTCYTAETMHDFAQLRETEGKNEEARTLYAHALITREQRLGTHHPKTMETRKRLIILLRAIGQHEQATQLEAVQSEL